MSSFRWCIFISFVQSAISLPQTNNFKMPNVDFSSAQEINSLEPSPTPEIENRSYDNDGKFLEATLEEVQNILKASPDLPRLTKGEILDLIENITKTDMEKLRALNRNRIGKSVLLVMPYSPKKNGENMEELFTKKPVTELVDNENKDADDKKLNRKKKPTFSVKKENNRIYARNNTKTNFRLPSPTRPIITTSEIPYDTTSPMTTDATTLEVTTFRRRVRPPRTRPPTTTRPTRRRRRTTTPPTNIELKHDNKENSNDFLAGGQIDKFLPENAIRVTRPPVHYRFTRKTTTTPTPDLITYESRQENVYVKAPSISDPLLQTVDVNEYSHTGFQAHDELTRDGPVFKPISNQLFKEDVDTAPDVSTFKPLTGNVFIPEGFENILRDLKLDSTLKNQTVLEEAVRSNTVFPRTTTTTTSYPITPMPEFSEVADNLSPDMKSLLMTFGLIPNTEEEKKVPTNKEYRSEIIGDNPDAYVGFKPIPEDGAANKELDSLLASFGLGRSARKSKKIKKKVDSTPGLDLSVVPESMIGIVENLGLKNGNSIENNASDIHVSPLNTSLVSSKNSNDRIDEGYENENISAEDIDDISGLYTEPVATSQVLNTNDDSNENSTSNKISFEEITTTQNPANLNNTELPETSDIGITPTEPTAESNTLEVWIDSASENNDDNHIFADGETTTKGTLTSVVFNPTDQKIVEKEKEQLDKLVELIKALKRINGSATEEDFKNFDLDTLREFTKVLNDSQRTTLGEQIDNEINPLNVYEDKPKFKPKRQESTTEAVTNTPQMAEVTESKDEVFSLQDSFGQLPDEEIETTTARKYSSGVYYMIDWNTFMEVDNTKGTHVNLRFQPKVGDPGRFYAINSD